MVKDSINYCKRIYYGKIFLTLVALECNEDPYSPDFDSKDSYGLLHILNIGSVTAVVSRDGAPKKITYSHTAADKAERERVISNGGVVSSAGQVQLRILRLNLLLDSF